jgi:DNA-binding transcriptional LysR family regulator
MKAKIVRYFVVLAGELNYTRAARVLKIEQSTLSQAIVRLEAFMNARLFDRSRYDVSLTAAGQTFLPEARAIVRHVEFANRLAGVLRAPDHAPLTMGFSLAMLDRTATLLVGQWRRRYPQFPLAMREASSTDLLERLLSGEVDVAALHRPSVLPDDIRYQLIERRNLVAAIPADSPAVDAGYLTLRDLCAMPLILFPRAADPTCYDHLIEGFAAERLVPSLRHEAFSVGARLRLVTAGLGATLVPASMTHELPAGVVLRVVTDLPRPVHSDIILAWHRLAHPLRSKAFTSLATAIRTKLVA